MTRPYKLLSLIFFTLILSSCAKYRADFGKNIEIDPDSTLSKQKVATIKSVSASLFASGSFSGTNHIPIQYRLLKPIASPKKKEKIPLVVVFHGSNAVGNDNISQLGILAKLWAMPEISTKYPAYILAPQFPTRSSNYVMDKSRGVLTSIPQPPLSVALELIDSLKQTLNIDEKRIYVIGFSMGASSVINVLSAKPELFAAGVSISGIPQFDNVKALSGIPIWLIHGNLDTENPFNSDAQFFKEVSYQNKTRFWEFSGKAHNDIFSSIILGENIPKWLFKHTK
jgi:predicted peptidase